MKINFGNKKMGLSCEEEIDGSKTCKRYVQKGSTSYSTGTEVELIPDPNTCKVRIVGKINDDDKSSIMKEVIDMETRCKKGF